MAPGRFCLVLLLFASALASAFVYEGASWRGVGFPIVGLLVCLGISARHFLNVFSPTDLVGTEVKRGEIQSAPSEPGYFWAGRSLTFKEACQHFLVVGATGSGKSITLNLLMQSIVTKYSKPDGVKRRAVVYDAKADLINLLGGLCGGMERVKILNPLDERFTPWDISADITNDIDASELAAMLIPKNERENSPYFTNTARSLVAGVVKRLIAACAEESRKRKLKAWTLRDVIEPFESTERLSQFLDHPKTRYLQDHFSPENAKNFAGVKSTVDTCLEVYRSVAALMDASPNAPISLKEWVENGESVLVLGNHELSREATDTLNRLILQQLSKALIARDGVINPECDETWIFLDELREAGALQGLRQLLLRGRSKGVAVAMGFQDVEGIFAAYGEHEGAEIIGATQNTVILHLNPSAPKTAQWASDVFSSRRDIVATDSTNYGERNSSWGQQRSAQLVPNVYPIQFVELPMPTPEEGLQFYSFTHSDGYRHFHYGWNNDFLERQGYFQLDDPEKYPDFILNSRWEAADLAPWDKRDYLRLNFFPMALDKDEAYDALSNLPERQTVQ